MCRVKKLILASCWLVGFTAYLAASDWRPVASTSSERTPIASAGSKVELGKPKPMALRSQPDAGRFVSQERNNTPTAPSSSGLVVGGDPFRQSESFRHSTLYADPFHSSQPVVPVSGFNPPLPGGEEQYNCGVIIDGPPPSTGQPWSQCGDKGFWDRFPWIPSLSSFNFRSDHDFDHMISPMSNPYFFEDPRSLTEFRPIILWQKLRGDNPLTRGGDAVLYTFQGRLAFNEYWSLVIHKFGFTTLDVGDDPVNPPLVPGGSGLTDLQIGPKFTFWRNRDTGTIAALGANFEIPTGSSRVLQGNGGAVTPYLTAAQRIWDFNLMGAAGYRFGFSSQRADMFFVSGHIDYNFANKFFPLAEINWYRYTKNGNRFASDVEGGDAFTVGSDNVKGNNLLTVALGARYKFSESFQIGAAYEFPVIKDNDLMRWRLNFDLILRY